MQAPPGVELESNACISASRGSPGVVVDCAECGEAGYAGDRFCRHCGAPAPYERPSAAHVEPARLTIRRGLVATLLAAGVLAAGGTAAVVLSGASTGSPPRDAVGSATTGAGLEGKGPIVPGRYVLLGSFRTARRAAFESERLRRAGLDAAVYDSNTVAGLQPAFFVLLAGPLSGAADEARALRRARRAHVIGPRSHRLGPARERSTPPAGRWQGTLARRAPAGSPLNRMIDAALDVAGDGRTAAMTLATPACRGELRLIREDGVVWTYGETISGGDCLGGGTWTVKPEGSEARLTWWHPDRTYFVVGTLEAR